MAAVPSEIRVRLDKDELVQAKQVGKRIGLPLNDAVKVFVRKFIEVGGLRFDMRQRAASDNERPVGERLMPIVGLSHPALAEIARTAAVKADVAHLKAGRLPPLESAVPDPEAGPRTR